MVLSIENGAILLGGKGSRGMIGRVSKMPILFLAMTATRCVACEFAF